MTRIFAVCKEQGKKTGERIKKNRTIAVEK